MMAAGISNLQSQPTLLLVALVTLMALVCSQSAVHAEPIVQSCNGNLTYVGFITEQGVESFLNIPFGQDTGGPNRFKHPKPWLPPADSSGSTIINATFAGPACPQAQVQTAGPSLFGNVTEISEDCLSLRVARPVGTRPKDRLPVMVYIFGGGFTNGQVYDAAYTPDGLVLESEKIGNPVIYVAGNYRLNFFGFAASTELASEGSLNSALFDQRLALQWVQDNIADFGGDPEKVTFFGESAGAFSVAYQIVAFGGRQKAQFQRAIMESGNCVGGLPSSIPIPDLDLQFNALAGMVNCTPSSSTKAETLACVRRAPFDALNAAVVAYGNMTNPPNGLLAFVPVVDGDFIPLPASELLARGHFHRNVSTIHGWNEDDGSLFTPLKLNSTADIAEFLHAAWPGLTNESIATFLALYPESEFPTPFTRGSRINRDITFTCGSVYLARQLKIYGEADTHLYLLNQTALGAYIPTAIYGVSHIADIPYVFETVSKLSNSSSDQDLANRISGDWSSFSATGMPRQEWPKSFATEGSARAWEGEMLVLGGVEPGPVSIAKERLGERCAFIVSLASQFHE